MKHLTLFFPFIRNKFCFSEQVSPEQPLCEVLLCFTFVFCCFLTLCSRVVLDFIKPPKSIPLDDDDSVWKSDRISNAAESGIKDSMN